MGRALFSHSYASSPAVRTEPEPTVDHCEKWSSWNRFDPDSDEFFQDAETEQFLDPAAVQYRQEQDDQARAAIITDIRPAEGSESGESSDSGSESPLPMEDDMLAMVSPVEWQRRFLEAGASEIQWQRRQLLPARAQTIDQTSAEQNRLARPRAASTTVPFLPPASMRSAVDLPPLVPRSPTVSRRTVNITPINIPIEPSSPSPISSESPSPRTPPPQTYRTRTPSHSMMTPSPAPTVTPRVYGWQRHGIPAIPTSPTGARMTTNAATTTSDRDTPLPNPRARMSFARIDAQPARIRVQNTVM
ncbi:hypothetical protein BDQ12DRAFT_510472 [Crucibulum laeve]|uniref:Uncharacterized protein n=1 Tax=Crucibulum laeve TaxID=68775 RepID=A0A5C3MF16_9AGAR|nr:hypothetical protein BDQ12DRAFT_510472 [Crucibulum laeve]